MAISISFTGWANEIKTFEWGSVIKCTHKNRRKNDQGEWETVSTDYIDVVIQRDNLGEFAEILSTQMPIKVSVEGNAKFDTYEGKNGTGISIKVYPQSVIVAESTPRADSDAWAKAADAPF